MSNKSILAVIGGGAAGFFCAVNAARLNPGAKVYIIEKSNKLLSKVKVSGGGRCNVTHACDSISEMIKAYPRGANFLKKTFHHFFTKDTIEWFSERGVRLKTEADGRMFPESNSSQSVIDCLVREANRYQVELLMNAEVKTISREAGRFELHFASGRLLQADKVCIASGGYPKTTQFEWLTSLGHSIEMPVPSLFTFNVPADPLTKLMGVTVEKASVKINGTKLSESGPLLITHWGMSGPVILRLSAWGARILAEKNYSFSITVNWLPAFHEQSLKEHFQQLRFEIASQKIANRNPFSLPQRLWEYLLDQSGIKPEMRWADLPAKEQHKLIKTICAQEFGVKGKTTFKEEFVTCGGINLAEIDFNNMQSKLVPGLFFAGEILDIDGITGGYNFQNAWTTGWAAARGMGLEIES